MTSIGSPGRVIGPYPPRHDHEHRGRGDARRGDDDLADSGAGRHFGGDADEGGFGEGADRRAGGRPGDSATPHGQDGPSAGGDPAVQAELARQSAGFRRSLDAVTKQVAGPAAGSMPRLEGGGARGDGMSGFAQLFAPPAGDGGREGSRPADDADGAGEQVLAASSQAAASTLPLFPALQPAQEPAAGLHGHELTSAIEERVTQAIRAELAAQSGTANAITINLAGLVDGLDAITIRVSATGLDVVLSGSLNLAGEAQSLADRLSRRFANRSVRILTAASGSGLRATLGKAGDPNDGDGDGDGGGASGQVGRSAGDTA